MILLDKINIYISNGLFKLHYSFPKDVEKFTFLEKTAFLLSGSENDFVQFIMWQNDPDLYFKQKAVVSHKLA